ncbi:MAG: hypothetical protein MUE54_01750 [Anaerolineae bacterium]|nr:hypothetical protein [Anaerolineae bacterium]
MNFETWLQTATQGLPQNRLGAIRAELTGHYLDAVDDYLLQGLSSDNAHTLALRELGDACAVCNGLRSAHIHRSVYWRAMVIACLPSLSAMLGLTMVGRPNPYNHLSLWVYAIFIAISGLLTVWATRNSLRVIGMIAYLGDEGDLPITLIQWGLYILFPISIFTTWSNQWVFIAIINTPTLVYGQSADFNHPIVTIVSILASFGLMLTGVGWVMLAFKITRLPSMILPLLRGTMFVMGMGITLLSVGAVMRDIRLTSISTTISLIFGILTFALFIILFYQLGRNTTPSRPSYA